MRIQHTFILLILLMFSFVACTATEEVLDLEEGDGITVQLSGWEASLEKKGDGTLQGDVPADIPTNLRVEVITKSGARYAGVYAPGTAVLLPEGSVVTTFSGTLADATQQLELVGRPTSGPLGGNQVIIDLSKPHELQQFLVSLTSVDAYDHQDDMDAYGEFLVTAASEVEAHAIVQAWYLTGGEDWAINQLIDDVLWAYTVTAYVDHGQGKLLIRALNDSSDMVASGSLGYQDGSQHALAWSKTRAGSALWGSEVVIDAGLLPLGSEGLLESIRFDLMQYAQGERFVTPLTIEKQGVPIP